MKKIAKAVLTLIAAGALLWVANRGDAVGTVLAALTFLFIVYELDRV